MKLLFPFFGILVLAMVTIDTANADCCTQHGNGCLGTGDCNWMCCGCSSCNEPGDYTVLEVEGVKDYTPNLGKREISDRPTKFNKLDVNRDGVISAEEAQARFKRAAPAKLKAKK